MSLLKFDVIDDNGSDRMMTIDEIIRDKQLYKFGIKPGYLLGLRELDQVLYDLQAKIDCLKDQSLHQILISLAYQFVTLHQRMLELKDDVRCSEKDTVIKDDDLQKKNQALLQEIDKLEDTVLKYSNDYKEA